MYSILDHAILSAWLTTAASMAALPDHWATASIIQARASAPGVSLRCQETMETISASSVLMAKATA